MSSAQMHMAVWTGLVLACLCGAQPRPFLPAGCAKDFLVPNAAVDQYGNAVAWQNGLAVDPETSWPYEIWLRNPRMEFVLLTPGEFVIGQGQSGWRGPAHRVRLTRPVYLAKYETTQFQWEQLMAARPWWRESITSHGPRHPAMAVSWHECQRLAARLSVSTHAGPPFRLPTEAEWEYACRAGSTTSYPFGNDVTKLNEYEWFASNADGQAHAVGTRSANAWGFHDMLGNVNEWCSDWFAKYSAEEQTDPGGPAKGRSRTIRGGSLAQGPVTTAGRGSRRPGGHYASQGVRLAFCPSAMNTTNPPVEEAMKPFDDLMTAFMSTHDVPGAALAVTKDGRLVYARGFGYADRARTRAVVPTARFRIASVSKPVTATAIMQLVEQGKLDLDARIFELLSYTPHLAEGTQPDPRLATITIRHLLLHQGGWDRDKSFSVMGIRGTTRVATALGVPMPPTHAHMIRYMMGQPLQFGPGTRSSYSNFGYILLGRAIEVASGQTYEQYVTQHVLGPVDATGMRIGGTAREELVPGEVEYGRERMITASFGPRKGERVHVPYARCIPVMDANGGWIASVVDLMRFAVAFDKPDACPILHQGSIEAMFARPKDSNGYDSDGKPRIGYYAFGWQVTPNGRGGQTTGHGGNMEGTSSSLVRRHDGINWVVLFNAHASPAGGSLAGAIRERLHLAADSVKEWPTHDLFGQFR
jgi:CubicO group peptidase (beta-lactamase class C family)